MKIQTFKRYERKYMITQDILEEFLAEIQKHMSPDPYSKDGARYSIYNIYFDDSYEFIRHSLSKPYFKQKLRMRSYTPIAGADDQVFLELKKKIGSVVSKRRAYMSVSDAMRLIGGTGSPSSGKYIDKQVCNEIASFVKNHSIRPTAYIKYDRIAFFDNDDPELRLTIDFNIVGKGITDVYDWKNSIKLLSDDKYIMEIKVSNSIPLWLTDILSKFNIRRTRFSKYGVYYTLMRRDELGLDVSGYERPMMYTISKG